MRHRDYSWDYAPAPDVQTPVGPMNTGYVTSNQNAAKWQRGKLAPMADMPSFGLGPPHGMREPGTNTSTYNFAG